MSVVIPVNVLGKMTGRCGYHQAALARDESSASIFGDWRCPEGDDGRAVVSLRGQLAALGPADSAVRSSSRNWAQEDLDEYRRLAMAMAEEGRRCRESWVFEVPS